MRVNTRQWERQRMLIRNFKGQRSSVNYHKCTAFFKHNGHFTDVVLLSFHVVYPAQVVKKTAICTSAEDLSKSLIRIRVNRVNRRTFCVNFFICNACQKTVVDEVSLSDCVGFLSSWWMHLSVRPLLHYHFIVNHFTTIRALAWFVQTFLTDFRVILFKTMTLKPTPLTQTYIS